MFKFWFVRSSRSARNTFRRTASHGRRGSRRASLEALEQRTVLAAVSWINPAGGDWNVASNWSSGAVPTSADDVTIDTAAAITIAIHSGDNISISSLTTGTNDALSFSGGSLAVSAASVLDGPLSMTGGALSASGASASLTALGATTISGANFSATNGGRLSLPKLTSFTADNSNFNADGAGSVLDLSALTAITPSWNAWAISSMNGAEINLSSLASLQGFNKSVSVIDTGGSTLLAGNLTHLSGVRATFDGTDAKVADSWIEFEDGALTVTGGAYVLPGLHDIDRSSLTVVGGGRLAAPGVVSYVASGNWVSDGVGSVLNLSGLVNVTSPQSTSWLVAATRGGELSLGSLTSLTSENGIAINVGAYGLLLAPKLVDLNGVSVVIDGSDAHIADSWTKFSNGSLRITGGSYSLPALTDVGGSSFFVQTGGALTLSAVVDSSPIAKSFWADGPGSELNLPGLVNVSLPQGSLGIGVTNGGKIEFANLKSLTCSFSGIVIIDNGDNSRIVAENLTRLDGVNVSLDGSDAHFADSWKSFTNGLLSVDIGSYTLPGLVDVDGSRLYVFNGGNLTLPGITSYDAGSSIVTRLFLADGAGSTLDLPALANVVGSTSTWDVQVANSGIIKLSGLTSLTHVSPYAFSIRFSGDGTILADHLTSLSGIAVNLSGAGEQAASAWTAFTNGSISVYSGDLTLPALTDFSGSTANVASGGRLRLPALTTLVPSDWTVFSADGAGSLIDLSALVAVDAQHAVNFTANGGGVIDLSNLTSLNGRYITSFQDVGNSRIINHLTSLDGVNVQLDGTDAHVADTWTALTHGNLTVTGGAYSLPNLVDVDGSGLTALGGASLALPGLTGVATNPSFRAEGAGSVLDVSGLTGLTSGSFGHINANSGGVINLTGLTSLASLPHRISFTDIDHGAVLLSATLTELSGVDLSIDGTDAHLADAWTKFTDGALTVTGGDYLLPNLANVNGSSLYVENGASLGMPGLVSYASDETAFQASGAGSVLDLSALANVAQSGAWAVSAWGGGNVKLGGLTALTSSKGMQFIARSGPSTIELPNLTAFGGANARIVVGDGGSMTLDGKWLTMPSAGYNVAVNVPQLPFDAAIFLSSTGTFDRATFSIGSGDHVSITDGTFTGEILFDVSPGATLDLTGGNLVNYSGSLRGAGEGTVLLAGGGVTVGAGGLALDFAGEMFQWTGGGFYTDAGDVENHGALRLTGDGEKELIGAGALDNFGQMVQSGAGNLNLHSYTSTPATLKIEPGGTYLLESDSGVTRAFGGPAAIMNAGTISKTSGGVSTLAIDGLFDNEGTVSLTGGAGLSVGGDFMNRGRITLGPASTLSVGGNFTQTAAGAFNEQIGGSPGSGQFGKLVVQQHAQLGGALNVSLVDGFAPSEGQDFEVMSFAGASGDFASTTGVVPGFAQQINPTSLDLTAKNAAPHEKYVAAVYEDVLGRAPDADGLAYWTGLLDGGAATSSVAEAIAHSDEYYANFVIKPDYLRLLGRAADDAAVTYWTAKMHAGLTDQQLETELVSSDEFFKNAGGTNAAWIDSIYKLLLGRTAGAGEAGYWTGQLSAGQSRSDVARSIANSPENNAQLINADYFHYLGRAADPDGLKYWLEQFAAGKTNEDVIAGFTGSDEYYKQHTS